MAFWNRKKTEQRASVENPRVPLSSENLMASLLGMDCFSIAGIQVNVENALGIPAMGAAVNFIAGTIAGLPLHLYKKTDSGREQVKGGLATLLHDAWSEDTSSFDGRKYSMERVLTGGRSITFIERNTMGRIINLWPLNPEAVSIRRRQGRKVYTYTENGVKHPYNASEVIDIPFSLCADRLTARSPIYLHKDTIALGIAATQYGSKIFNNGGVPPLSLEGTFQTGSAMQRASDDMYKAIKKANAEGRQVLPIPLNHKLSAIGIDPEKLQLVDLKRFLIEEYARIYSLPPVFIQDLTHGTYSNTEQQDLHFVKHTIKRWVVQIEQEMNLKLFGRNRSNQYVEFNLDGLLRGDFKTRMEGYATGIQNAILTPDEARVLENRPAKKGNADDLHIQGATVPLGRQPMANVPPQAANDPGEPDNVDAPNEPENDEAENDDDEL